MGERRRPGRYVVAAATAVFGLLVAQIALAGGGNGSSGPTATTSAVTTAKFKKLKKQVAQLRRELRTLERQPGPPGEDATKLFAYIGDNGGANAASIGYGNGVTTVDDPAGDNTYTVTFNRSLANCVVHATVGYGNPPAPGASTLSEASPAVNTFNLDNPAQVDVTFRFHDGTIKDTSFLLSALC